MSVPRPRRALEPAAILGCGLLLLCPAPAGAWGRLGHETIAAAVPARYPATLSGLRRFDGELRARVMDPDRRKSDPAWSKERFQHYIDLDEYPEFAADSLSHDRAKLERRHGAEMVERWGVVTWAVEATTAALADSMRAGRWESVPRLMADLCHYAGDLHQPLHCTGNYDGQKTGQKGVHARYEGDMLDRHAGDLKLAPGRAAEIENVLERAFAVAHDSQRLVQAMLDADRRASAAGVGTPAYYDTLWRSVGPTTLDRLSGAADLTASLIYTAWRRAGSPELPAATPAGKKD